MQVIKARERHLHLLVEMMHELAHSGVGRREQVDAVLERQVSEVLEDPAWTTLILRLEDGAPVGYAMFRFAPSSQHPGEQVALLHDFLVRRTHRRQGFGRRFFSHIHQTYFQGRVAQVFLTVPGLNERALAFWQAMNFQVEGVRMFLEPTANASDTKTAHTTVIRRDEERT